MIRRSLPGGDLLIPQDRHALHAGRIAAQLRDPPEPREAVLRAVRLHDAGWPLLDDAPVPLADGRPPHVFDHPDGFTVPAWRRSVAVARAVGALEGLLVSLHFSTFSRAFAAEQASLQDAWRIGIDPEVEAAGRALLRYCDALSLRLLCDEDQFVNLPPGVRYEDGRLDPWPFRTSAVEDRIEGRLVPRRTWSSASDLENAYREAPIVEIPLVLNPF